MNATGTFVRKLALGFGVVVVISLIAGLFALRALGQAIEAKDRAINVNAANLIDAEALQASIERKSSQARGYLLTESSELRASTARARTEALTLVERLEKRASTAEGKSLLGRVRSLEEEHQASLERSLERRVGQSLADAGRVFERDVVPLRSALDVAVRKLVAYERELLQEGNIAAGAAADRATRTVAAFLIALIASAALIGAYLTRALTGQIGAAVRHVESSSAELQAAANQQAMSAKEQSTAMNEITTTVNELLATSRQIAESARRVAEIAEQTAAASEGGDRAVRDASDSIGDIRRQVELMVQHVLDLGRKSQQIGTVLAIINELAEQTNILAVNATIEAAGAGEAGRRFAVVADEIRKLADRVGGSTREIRGLVDEVRSAVNATVMVTESGAKSVETGSRQFSQVTDAFQRIRSTVGTTSEAAREIELSTKQQASAVEQVNLALSGVAQVTRETEASSSQTLVTATQLTGLSRDLARLVQPAAAA